MCSSDLPSASHIRPPPSSPPPGERRSASCRGSHPAGRRRIARIQVVGGRTGKAMPPADRRVTAAKPRRAHPSVLTSHRESHCGVHSPDHSRESRTGRALGRCHCCVLAGVVHRLCVIYFFGAEPQYKRTHKSLSLPLSVYSLKPYTLDTRHADMDMCMFMLHGMCCTQSDIFPSGGLARPRSSRVRGPRTRCARRGVAAVPRTPYGANLSRPRDLGLSVAAPAVPRPATTKFNLKTTTKISSYFRHRRKLRRHRAIGIISRTDTGSR